MKKDALGYVCAGDASGWTCRRTFRHTSRRCILGAVVLVGSGLELILLLRVRQVLQAEVGVQRKEQVKKQKDKKGVEQRD